MSKYNELQKKTKYHLRQYREYEGKCRQLITDLRTALINYLGCLDNRVILLRLSPDEPEEIRKAKGIIEFSLDLTMCLFDDAYYGFTFRIKLYDPDQVVSGGSYLDLPLLIKKENSSFTVKIGKEVKRFNDDELIKFVEYLVTEIDDFLDNEFHRFLKGGEKKPWGLGTGKE